MLFRFMVFFIVFFSCFDESYFWDRLTNLQVTSKPKNILHASKILYHRPTTDNFIKTEKNHHKL